MKHQGPTCSNSKLTLTSRNITMTLVDFKHSAHPIALKEEAVLESIKTKTRSKSFSCKYFHSSYLSTSITATEGGHSIVVVQDPALLQDISKLDFLIYWLTGSVSQAISSEKV